MSPKPPTAATVRRLDQALDRLSWSPERQLAGLRRWRVGPDELALEFDDAFRMVPALASQGALPDGVVTLLRRVDATLAEMTDGTDSQWTDDAVTDSPMWHRLRRTAQEALEALRGLTPAGGGGRGH